MHGKTYSMVTEWIQMCRRKRRKKVDGRLSLGDQQAMDGLSIKAVPDNGPARGRRRARDDATSSPVCPHILGKCQLRRLGRRTAWIG